MPSKSLRLRLVLPLACVLIGYGGFHTYLSTKTQSEEILSEATASTLRLANTVRRSTRHAMLHSRREDVHRMIEDIGEQEGIEHVRIFNKQGMIMYSSEPDEINRVVDRNAEACYQCHDAEEPLTRLDTSKRARVFQTNGYRTLAAIDVIHNEPSCYTAACHAHPKTQNLLGVVDIGISLKDADIRVAKAKREEVLLGILSTLVICGLVGLFIRRSVTKPVGHLMECTRRIAQGDLTCTITATADDEIGHLAKSFRKMTEDLRRARGELSEWGHRLEEEVENKTHDLQLAQAQIVRSEKLSSIGLLAAGVAHELNSPLTGILTYAHLLAKRLPEGSSEREDLQVIVNQTERCARIIRQLLDFSRESSPEKRSHDVHDVLEQAIALVERQALFHDIEIERDLAPDLPEVLMDACQMQQVLLNLLVNAGEAMSAGGRLTVMTRACSAEGLSPSASGAAYDEVRIVLRDTGAGILPEDIDKVFDPFFTSKDVGQGTGLGLAVSYGIIERHGGTIGVESTPGEGTAFTISLPIRSSDSESA